MKSKYLNSILIASISITLVSCTAEKELTSPLLDSLTFHASFDEGPHADFAKGEKRMFNLVQMKPDPVVEVGLPAEAVLDSAGRFGNCLFFNTPEGVSGTRAFFRLKDNMHFSNSDWSGTVSFWLRVSPDEDLRPGYTDPIQLTPRSALDGCLWVDFSLDEHRQFRMGAFPDRKFWNPKNIPNKEIPDNQRPLIPVVDPPFSRDHWSHIVMTFEGFNNIGKNAVAKLYIDGKFHDDLTGWEQVYTWNIDVAQIRLGVNFVGAIDELSLFNRNFSPNEVAELYTLEDGVNGLLESR